MERGLILSPGFPNNYSSGMHCIWQFFVPARAYLMLEIFDFDVFESRGGSQNTWDGFLPLPKNRNQEISPAKESSDLPSIFSTQESVLQDSRSENFTSLRGRLPELASQVHELKQIYETETPNDSTSSYPTGRPFMETTNVTWPAQNVDGLAVNQDPKEKILFAYLTARGKDVDAEDHQKHLVEEEPLGEDVTISATPTDTSSALQPAAEVCPHDVLYVSDLIAFSSRFCGTNSPFNKNMTFGSPLKMVEVIVELITTTDRGRGFAMLFDYKNDTELAGVDDSKEGRENVMMLVIIAGILFFALVLLSSLCIACRQKLCPKRSSLDAGCDQENGIQNAGVDINELRLVIPSQENENNNHSIGGNRAVTSCDGSMELSPPRTDPDAPHSMSAVTTESGSDEVFIISAGPGSGSLSFTSYRIQDKSLKRSITSPGAVSDWVAADRTGAGTGAADPGVAQAESHCPRQRTWSARAFQDLLAPLPLLQKKCCSWTTSSPFAKPVKGGGFPASARHHPTASGKVTSAAEIEGASELPYSDLLASTASYPLTHSAQKQRRMSGCNLKKSRFGNPYFGFLTSSPDCNPKQLGLRLPASSQSKSLKTPPEDSIRSGLVNGSKSKELTEMDNSKPVFVISEEGDDQQPLVLAEHVNQCADALSEPNIVHNLGMVIVDEQATNLTVQGEGCAEPTNLRTDLDLWGEYPTPYPDSLKGRSACKEQSYVPVADTGTTSAHQNFDSLVSLTFCQTSVQ
ncbi:hypothetical protein lerEdw1_003659 [Lerista edwardsae]|nr:hypothetical protein lerEdw1_003659 [Lerista edwardsae]